MVDELSLKLREIEKQNGLDDTTVENIDDDATVRSEQQVDPIKKVSFERFHFSRIVNQQFKNFFY